MGRKLICVAALIVLMIFLAVPASAVCGMIRVDLGGEGEVAIYPIGTAEDGGYRLSAQYGGGFLTFDDILSGDLAAWLAQRAGDGISRETEQGIAVFEGLGEGLYLVVQTEKLADGTAFKPFLISLPWDGYLWAADVAPRMEPQQEDAPQTGDEGSPVFGVFGMLLSALGIAICVIRKEKCSKEDA